MVPVCAGIGSTIAIQPYVTQVRTAGIGKRSGRMDAYRVGAGKGCGKVNNINIPGYGIAVLAAVAIGNRKLHVICAGSCIQMSRIGKHGGQAAIPKIPFNGVLIS